MDGVGATDGVAGTVTDMAAADTDIAVVMPAEFVAVTQLTATPVEQGVVMQVERHADM